MIKLIGLAIILGSLHAVAALNESPETINNNNFTAPSTSKVLLKLHPSSKNNNNNNNNHDLNFTDEPRVAPIYPTQLQAESSYRLQAETHQQTSSPTSQQQPHYVEQSNLQNHQNNVYPAWSDNIPKEQPTVQQIFHDVLHPEVPLPASTPAELHHPTNNQTQSADINKASNSNIKNSQDQFLIETPNIDRQVNVEDQSSQQPEVVKPTTQQSVSILAPSSYLDPSKNLGYIKPLNNKFPVPNQATTPMTLSSATSSTPIPTSTPKLYVNPMLIYSTRYEIRGFDLANFSLKSLMMANSNQQNFSTSQYMINSDITNNNNPQNSVKYSKAIISGLKNTIGLDFYYSPNESFIYWTDVNEERIYRGSLSNWAIANAEVVVQTGLATAEGLAIDWIGHNIYWVESTLDHIEVANMNGSHRRTLICGDMESPRAIAVDPRYGYIFWTDWDKKNPRIERATMSGDDRRILFNIKTIGGGWPNGLTLDYDKLRVYWIDANSDSIHVMDYDGSMQQTLLGNTHLLGHPFSISLYDDSLFWTDWKTNSISTTNKYNPSDARELQRQPSRLFDIKVFHPSRQPRIGDHLNPCHIKNGNCSHLCLLSTNYERKCECPNLMKLTSDGRNCEPDEYVLLIGKSNEIKAVSAAEPLRHIMAPIVVPKVFNPRQFEFDAKSKTIYWVDSQTSEVKRVSLLGGQIETIIDVIIDTPTGLALDWISGNIYVSSSPQFTAKPAGKIFVSNLNGEFISILMDTSHDVLTGVLAPKSIAVHPDLGLLFCIDENENSEPIIFYATMDGENKRIIASPKFVPKLSKPSSLAVDINAERVYWINRNGVASHGTSIQYYDIMKNRVVSLETNREEQILPRVLAVDGDNLIIGGRMGREVIIRVPKNDLTNVTVLKTQNLDQTLSALRVFNASAQFGTNACAINNGGCSQLCIPVNGFERTCKCTIGYHLVSHNATQCIGEDHFLIYSFNLGMKGISPEPNSSPDDYKLPPIHRTFRASSIDFVYRDNLIYWVDNEEGSITRINRDTTNYQVVVQGLESEESIAIDWVAGNMYWLDPYYDIIEVARLNGSNRYVIVSGDMEKANGIVVNPLKGYIVWSDIGSSPKIEFAQLDGSNRHVLVNTNLSHIDDIAIDCDEDYIYWVDSSQGIVERIRDDGQNRQLVWSSPASTSFVNNGVVGVTLTSHLVSIAVHKDYIYIADSVSLQGSITKHDKHNGLDKRLVQSHLGDGIRDIAIFAEQPIPSVDQNPCVIHNGGCEGLCLYLGKPGERRCICSHGKLNKDGHSCKPYDEFILYSRGTQIDSLHVDDNEAINNSPYPSIVIENRASIITVDHESKRIIYSELSRDQICSIKFDGSDRRVIVDKQSNVEGLAYANNLLYWTKIYDNSISRYNISSLGVRGETCGPTTNSTKTTPVCKKATVEKIVKLGPDDKPRGIAVDTCTWYVYWTNWNNNASIQRASPHNNYKIESIITTNIRVPNGIAIDQKTRKLFWCDARLDKIESCDMDGTNRIVLIASLPQHPFALAVWQDYVFWTDWLARGVFKADKYTGQNPKQIKKLGQKPIGIAVAAPDTFECSPNVCQINNGGCPANHRCSTNSLHDTTSHLSTKVLCKPISSSSTSQIANHLSFKPLPYYANRCKHSRNGTSCATFNYHDIIMDRMDRYNLSEIISLNPKQDTTSTTTRSTGDELVNGSSSTSSSTTMPPMWLSNGSMSTTNSNVIEHPKLTIVDQLNTTTTTSSNISLPPSSSNSTVAIVSNSTSTPGFVANDTTSTTTVSTSTSTLSPEPIEVPTMPHSRGPISENISTASSSLATTTITDSPTSEAPVVPSSEHPSTTSATTTTTSGAKPTPTEAQVALDCNLPNLFRCESSGLNFCVGKERRCDGSPDCPNHEDEANCSPITGSTYKANPKAESTWQKFPFIVMAILVGAAMLSVVVFYLTSAARGGRRSGRWFVSPAASGFHYGRMFDDHYSSNNNGGEIEISNPVFEDDDLDSRLNCPFSIDLNERTTNFSNPLYERQVLLMNDKLVTPQ